MYKLTYLLWHPRHHHELISHIVNIVHSELGKSHVQCTIEHIHEIYQLNKIKEQIDLMIFKLCTSTAEQSADRTLNPMMSPKKMVTHSKCSAVCCME